MIHDQENLFSCHQVILSFLLTAMLCTEQWMEYRQKNAKETSIRKKQTNKNEITHLHISNIQLPNNNFQCNK